MPRVTNVEVKLVEILSLWRSPIDAVAIRGAESLRERQPRCTSIPYDADFSLMTIYNFGDYITDNPPFPPADTALTQMFSVMSSASPIGGLAFIPQQNFPIDASPAGYTVPDQCNITGSGGGGPYGGTTGTSFFHFTISDPLHAAGASFFLNCTGEHTAGGKYFRNLSFQWVSAVAGDTCISAGTWNCRAINCTFTDCPIAVTSVDSGNTANGESCTLEQCTIDYSQGPGSTTAVLLSGAQCGVIGPSTFAQTSPGSGGPAGCTCIAINSPAEHAVIINTQIYEWTFGIDFSQKPGSRYTTIANCEIECWRTALNVVLPSGSGATTAGIKVSGCTLAKTSDSTDSHSIALIDANGANAQLADISLIDCTVFNMARSTILGQHGLQVATGSNIRVIGGTYSNNSSSGGAGIAITGNCSDVQIIGANLQPSYPGAPNTNNQQYALLVSGNTNGYIIVSGCDMTGYGGSPVHVTGSPTKLFITDCLGYNDQNSSLNGGMAPLSTTSAATSSTPYFGPSLFTWNHSVPVTVSVFGQSYTAVSGIIFLPSPYDGFSMSASPLLFSWTGK